MKRVAWSCLGLVLLVSWSCTDPHYGLKKWQIDDLRTWQAEGQPIVTEKGPALATGLSFFIGLGAFYTHAPILGVLDLLLWPVSVLWEPWITPGLANEINYEATKHAWEHRVAGDAG